VDLADKPPINQISEKKFGGNENCRTFVALKEKGYAFSGV